MDLPTTQTVVEEALDYHNFILENFFAAPKVDARGLIDECLYFGEVLRPMVADVTTELHGEIAKGSSILFEGAQGALLDIDHGTYPFVTSSNTTAGAALTGTGVGPKVFDAVIGITKAYTTRVGGGPFPTELFDEVGDRLSQTGQEFGATTGRPRRCGWFDAVTVKHSCRLSSITGLCITKLDVLDQFNELRICTAYECAGEKLDIPPGESRVMEECTPVYETLSGWNTKTAGIRNYEDFPAAAKKYIERLSELVNVPIQIISIGAERQDTLILHHPFE
jgi:adenylosuccinate synthase